MNYIIALNFWYHINIAMDHDTYETIIENHYTGKDWLKLQICNSANFLNQSWLWTRFFGGINYQIEHHLFPNMSNVHYPTISPIVQDFCKENGITYIHYDNLWKGYQSYLKMLKVRNSI
jgi:linoleoyl-CoA desaturase